MSWEEYKKKAEIRFNYHLFMLESISICTFPHRFCFVTKTFELQEHHRGRSAFKRVQMKTKLSLAFFWFKLLTVIGLEIGTEYSDY